VTRLLTIHQALAFYTDYDANSLANSQFIYSVRTKFMDFEFSMENNVIPNSFCTHAANSVNFIDELGYRKECYIHYERGDVGGCSPSLRDPYIAHASVGIQLKMPVLVRTHWRWVIHAGGWIISNSDGQGPGWGLVGFWQVLTR